ncbi:MAG: UDP-N-acetylmuramate--L-alanine ligase [Ktedonobacterales bacterium]|nr:UDP-N-acetylmuramate--L-alanine ligase [Ktedonobacterales bacterium]
MEDLTSLLARFPDGLHGKRLHAMGAGGSGISAVLRLARERGALVTGCDAAMTTMARALGAHGIAVALGHDPAHVAGADLVLTTPAITYPHPDHPELTAARERGIPVAQWQVLLGYLMRESIGVSVAGVHGKGSTTAMLGALAIAGRLDPTCEVGALVKDWGANLFLGHGPYFINEADEFNYNFLHYHPRLVVLTAVEYDHPEFFQSYEAIREAFVRFLRGMDMAPRPGALPPTLVLNADNPGCREVLERLGAWPGEVRWFGMEREGEGAEVEMRAEDVRAEVEMRAEEVRDDTETSFELRWRGEALGRVTLELPGRHNIANALAAAAAAMALGVDRTLLAPALSAFGGLRRRFEVIAADDGVTFIDDYAHHPHAVALTLGTVRRRFPGRRVVAVFQPTLYTRLARFLELFSQAFDAADVVVIVETQPSRERDTGLVHGTDLVRAVAARPTFVARPDAARYGGTYAETAALLRALRQPGDVIVVMGSGPVNQVITGGEG